MSMAWAVILTLFAGSGGQTASQVRDHGCLAVVVSARSSDLELTRSPFVARKFDHRPSSNPWSSPEFDEFDTEEVDESWMVHLDILATVPVAWHHWDLPCSAAEQSFLGLTEHPTAEFIPLRC